MVFLIKRTILGVLMVLFFFNLGGSGCFDLILGGSGSKLEALCRVHTNAEHFRGGPSHFSLFKGG